MEKDRATLFLGLDIGSTTIKVVLIDKSFNHMIEPIYLRSMGQPLEALKQACRRYRDRP